MIRIVNSLGFLVCYSTILIWTGIQSIIGLMQLLGFCSSNNLHFAITGSFNNPGPYGGFVAIGIAVASAGIVTKYSTNWSEHSIFGKTIAVFSLLMILLGILVLPSTISRAAWLALAVSLFVLLVKEFNLLEYFGKHRVLTHLSIIIILSCSVGAFILKPESALGRLHIWRIECLSIAEEPITGHGYGSALGSYGATQAEFFKSKERCNLTIRLAGCPEYAFNEYLKVGVEYGIPVMIAFIVVVYLSIRSLLRKRSPLGYGLIVFAVFAFFSYPLSLWEFQAIGLILIASAVPITGRFKYVGALALCAALTASVMLIMNKPKPNENKYRQKYALGYALHQEGQYVESNRLLKEGAAISSDPMFYNIIGKNLEAMGDYDSSEKAFLHSHYMVPSRLYPLVLLMEMNARQGKTAQAIKYADMAISLPVNKNNPNMSELHNRALSFADSLKSSSLMVR